jgi:hypothetical protein
VISSPTASPMPEIGIFGASFLRLNDFELAAARHRPAYRDQSAGFPDFHEHCLANDVIAFGAHSREAHMGTRVP